MKISTFLFGIAFLSVAVAEELAVADANTAQLRGNVAARELDSDTGKQIKRRFDTFKCLSFPGKGTFGRFEDCKDRKDEAKNGIIQYFEFDRLHLVSSYLKQKDKELWCVTFVPDSNQIALEKCVFGRHNTQRWSFASGNFKCFYESETCLEGPGNAHVGHCEFVNEDQEFLFDG